MKLPFKLVIQLHMQERISSNIPSLASDTDRNSMSSSISLQALSLFFNSVLVSSSLKSHSTRIMYTPFELGDSNDSI